MARRTPLIFRNTRAPRNDNDPTETNFGGGGGDEVDDDEEEEMTEEQRRRARGDATDDDEEEREEDDEEEEEEEDDEEEEEEEEDEEDEEEEEEEEDEEEEEEDEGDDPAFLEELAGGGSKMVPISRLNEALALNSKLVDAVLAARTGGIKDPAKPEEPVFDLAGKKKEYRAALLDGDEAKAEALDREIDEYLAKKAKRETEEAVTNTVTEAMERIKVENTVAAMQRRFPIFNDQSASYDPTALQDMIDLRDVYYRRGMPLADAVRKACERIAGATVGGDAGGKAGKAAKKGKSDRQPSKAGQDNRSIRDKRRAVEAQRRQPSALARAGSGDRAVSRINYGEDGPSESQIRRMSPKDKAIARGDYVGKGK